MALVEVGETAQCTDATALAPCGEAGRCWDGACVEAPACPDEDCGAERNFPVPDTNLRFCTGPAGDGEDGTIECPGVAGAEDCADTELCGQDAQYGWDLDQAAELRWSASGGDEPVVTDLVTGLAWQGCALGQAGADCAEGEATVGDWYNAAEACEALSWGGHDDWVLPGADALHTLGDFGVTGPALDEGVFPAVPGEYPEVYDNWWIDCAWSGTDLATDEDVAWVFMTNSGDIAEGSGTKYHLNTKDAADWEGCHARCVRAPEAAAHARFGALGGEEPVVLDHVAGRAWTACAAGQAGADCAGEAELLDWPSALAWCEGLEWAGREDWRLPDVAELRSIVELRADSPAIDAELFPNTPYYGEDTRENVGQFWSSTARDYNSFALYVEFRSGFSHFYVMEEGRHVRCVR